MNFTQEIILNKIHNNDDEALQIVAKHRLPQYQQARVRELLFKNREGNLTDAEELELDNYMAKMDHALEVVAEGLLSLAKRREQK